MSTKKPVDNNGRYILDGHKPVPEPDLHKWGTWLEGFNRKVARTELLDGSVVSTVFLGLDHNFEPGHRRKILFETMIFGGPQDGYQERCSTWIQAEKMHRRVVKMARGLK